MEIDRQSGGVVWSPETARQIVNPEWFVLDKEEK